MDMNIIVDEQDTVSILKHVDLTLMPFPRVLDYHACISYMDRNCCLVGGDMICIHYP